MDSQDAARRDPARDATAEEAKPYIERIDRLTEAGRINWFGLMAYLVFAFITVLGVEDADFFIPSRQTQLPLVNVAIPTEAFFYFAPVLGVALYVYLHLYVRKATGALCAAPATVDDTPLEEHLKPWLLNDMVLRRRKAGAIKPRPLDSLTTATVIALVWCAGPVVLGAIWLRSWPAHNEYMTTLAGACFALSLYAGHVSWVRMTRDLAGRSRVFTTWDLPRFAIVTALTYGILWLGWTKTESGAPWDRRPEQTASMTGALTVFVRTLPNVLEPEWWSALSPARLSEIQFAALRPDQADPLAARHRFRDAWCDRHGMDAKTCGRMPEPGSAPYPKAGELHDAWCDERGIPKGADCEEHISGLENEFKAEWERHRDATIAVLPKPDLRTADLRGADLSNAYLTGVVLLRADMEGANLDGTQMEGADLRYAKLNGASLRNAQLAGVDARSAQMSNADLGLAQLEGALLRDAILEGADLYGAKMAGAHLEKAQLAGANLIFSDLAAADLSMAEMAGASLSDAQMDGADLSGARLRSARLSYAKLNNTNFHRANLEEARLIKSLLNGADLSFAQLRGAILNEAQMTGADLRRAELVRANLDGANMTGTNLQGARVAETDLRRARLNRAYWDRAILRDSPAHFADFRGGSGLRQSHWSDLRAGLRVSGLSSLVGNAATLLPLSLEDGEKPYVCTCWNTYSPNRQAWNSVSDGSRNWFCPGKIPLKTGTPWPPNRATPWEEAGIKVEEWLRLQPAPTEPCLGFDRPPSTKRPHYSGTVSSENTLSFDVGGAPATDSK